MIDIRKLNKKYAGSKERLINWVKKHRVEIVLAFLVFLYIGFFTFLTFTRHANFLSSRYDLGNMDQTVWNSAHGNYFQLTQPEGESMISRFSIHADIFLVFMGLFYKIIASPYVLLFVQTLVLALGTIPLYLLGNKILKNKVLALAVCFAYLMFPPMHWANFFDFHSVTLATSFVLFAFYFMYCERYWLFAIFSLFLLSTKETMAFLVIMFGLYIIIKNKKWLIGLATIAISILWFSLLLGYIMPEARGDGTTHFALGYYSALGNNPGEIVRTVLTKPDKWVPQFFTLRSIKYIVIFLAPGGLLAIFSPMIFLMAFPQLALNLLSNYSGMQTIMFQYTSAITPFAFLSLIFGISNFRAIIFPRLSKLNPTFFKKIRVAPMLTVYIIITTLITSWLLSPLPGMEKSVFNNIVYTKNPAKDYLDHLVKTIPRDAAVSATTFISPHFTNRKVSYLFPNGVGKADYIVVQESDWYELYPVEQMSQYIRSLEKDPRYKLIYKKGKVEVFKKI